MLKEHVLEMEVCVVAQIQVMKSAQSSQSFPTASQNFQCDSD